MALSEPENLIKPHNVKFFVGKNYELAINQSIQSLLNSLQNADPDLSVYTSAFLELMQAKPKPLLETIWVFSGLNFHIDNSSKDNSLDPLSAVRDLFQSITACSASCSPSICIVLMAPVILELYRVVVDLKRKDFDLKRGKKVRREIRSFLDVILGYFNLCREGSNVDKGSVLVSRLMDLVSIWLHGEGIGDGAGKNGLRQFFPLLSDETLDWISEEGGDVLELLAGAVIMEAFLLKLCLKFGEGCSRGELQKELRTWAVCSVTGFHNFYFFDILVKMLLEPTLPVLSLLSSEDESFMRNMLYDIVILPNYSFLHLDQVGHLPSNHIKNNVLARLMVTHEAVEFFRKNGDHTKCISYTNAFSGSSLPTLLVKLVTSELGTQGRSSQPNGSSPAAFLKWVLDLENQGLRLSDGFMSKHHARLTRCISMADLDQLPYQLDAGKTGNDLLFFIDNKGKSDDDDSMNEAFVAAAHAMQSDANGSGKKRKETSAEKKKDRVKFQRYNVVDHSGSRSGSFDKDGSGSASEVEDPDSEEDLD